jgi:Flp pilus assembly protein TadG
MLRGRARRDDEQGAVIVTSVIVLTLMLGLAALVIDLGHQRALRREVQNAADSAALGAAQDLPRVTTAESTAKSLTTQNAPEGTFGWSACTDTGQLAFAAAGTPCVSFDSSYTRVRVRVPTQTFDTLFGKLLGTSGLETYAVAEARGITTGFGTIQPFALYSGFGSGLVCLDASSSGTGGAYPCNEPQEGNFGLLDLRQYGNATLGTIQRCSDPDQQVRLRNNVAIGADHLYGTYANPPGEVVEACTPVPVPNPDTVELRTGNFVQGLDLGLVHGNSTDFDDGRPARLQRGTNTKATITGESLDNRPLWEFIPNTTLSDVPSTCQRSYFDGLLASTPSNQRQATMHAALRACFDAYTTGNYHGNLFTANTTTEFPLDVTDLQLSPRFAYVPVLSATSPPSGSSTLVHIIGFRAVFLQETYAGCTANPPCSVEFEPGPWNTAPQGNKNTNHKALSSFVFAPSMLPGSLATKPEQLGENRYIELVK